MRIIFGFLIIWYSLWSLLKRKVLFKNIKKKDLVLDIGSGDKPHWRADVIVDKFPGDDRQRNAGEVLIDRKKLFVNADVEKMPFEDKVFDFVFCSHLLEHVEDPGKAIDEITRVGKRGYIEVPFSGLDLLKPFKAHLWFCDEDNGRLIFFKRDAAENFYTRVLKKFGKKLFETPSFQYVVAKQFNFFFVSLYWQGKIRYEIINKAKKPYAYSPQKVSKKKLEFNFVFYKILYLLMTFLFYRKKPLDKIEAVWDTPKDD